MKKITGVRRLAVGLTAVTALAGLAACESDEGGQPAETGARAVAVMRGSDGAAMGKVDFTQGPNGVLVSADLYGLAPGPHGFHLHAVGACAPDFSAAGGHFDPEGIGHGFMSNPDGSHAGDLPNIHAGADGAARADYFTSKVALGGDSSASLLDSDGSAVIVHAGPDSYGADPGAGARVACGVIEAS